jgi:predicted nucleic acid-binding protein
MRLYLDASAIIYGVEGVDSVRQAVIAWIARAEAENASGGAILTSRLSRLECRVFPLREQQVELLACYDEFFVRRSLTVVEIAASVIERATDLRVRYGLKTPDAIHVATAIDLQADLILTGDRDLARCSEVRVQIV